MSITKSDIVLTGFSSCALKARNHNKLTIFNSSDAKVFYPNDDFFVFKSDNNECFKYLMDNDPTRNYTETSNSHIDLGKAILDSLNFYD
jgi:hypothetical protein